MDDSEYRKAGASFEVEFDGIDTWLITDLVNPLYGSDGLQTNDTTSTALNGGGNWAVANGTAPVPAVVGGPCSGVTKPTPSGIAYTVSDFSKFVDDFLYQIDLNTGALTQIGVTGFLNIEALSFSPGGVLYGIDDTNDNLLTINVNTGAGTVVGPTFNVDDGAIAFDSNGNLWGADGSNGALYSIDPATGAATNLGATVDIVGMDALGTTLYAIDDDNNSLCTLNPPSPTCTTVGTGTFGFGDVGDGGLAFDCTGNLFWIDDDADALFSLDPATGIPVLIAGGIADFESLAIACPGGGPHADSTGNTTTDSSCWYTANDNGFRGFTFHDQGEHRATGGNHYCSPPVTITWDGYTICFIAPPGYRITGLHVNQSSWNPDISCITIRELARVDGGLEHDSTTNGAVNGAAVVADESAAAAEAVSGYAMGTTGGTFSCPVTNGNVNVIVPANVVADGTRFLCAANENPQSAAAPIGYSLVGSRVDLTTDTGLATFDSALTICLSYTVADILKAGGAAANLRVGFFDGVVWLALPVTSANANETCGLTDHFTQFGLMAATPTALPATGASVAPIVWLVAVVALGTAGIHWRRKLQLRKLN